MLPLQQQKRTRRPSRGTRPDPSTTGCHQMTLQMILVNDRSARAGGVSAVKLVGGERKNVSKRTHRGPRSTSSRDTPTDGVGEWREQGGAEVPGSSAAYRTSVRLSAPRAHTWTRLDRTHAAHMRHAIVATGEPPLMGGKRHKRATTHGSGHTRGGDFSRLS